MSKYAKQLLFCFVSMYLLYWAEKAQAFLPCALL